MGREAVTFLSSIRLLMSLNLEPGLAYTFTAWWLLSKLSFWTSKTPVIHTNKFKELIIDRFAVFQEVFLA